MTDRSAQDIIRYIARLHRSHTEGMCDDWPAIGSREAKEMEESLAKYIGSGKSFGKLKITNTPPSPDARVSHGPPQDSTQLAAQLREWSKVDHAEQSIAETLDSYALPSTRDRVQNIRPIEPDDKKAVKEPKVKGKPIKRVAPNDRVDNVLGNPREDLGALNRNAIKARAAIAEQIRIKMQEEDIARSVEIFDSATADGSDLRGWRVNQWDIDGLMKAYGRMPKGKYYALTDLTVNGSVVRAGQTYTVTYRIVEG